MVGNLDAGVPMLGEHWQSVGFQGIDPATDFRACGILSLWMMLQFYHHNTEQALKIFQASRKNDETYPFAAMCVVATSWVIQAARKGKLNALAEEMDPFQGRGFADHSHCFMEVAKRLFTGLMYK